MNTLHAAVWQAHFRFRRSQQYWAHLDDFTVATPEWQSAYMANALMKQIQHFGSRADALPEWRELASVTDPNEVMSAWRHLPILGKDDLRTRFHPRNIQQLNPFEGHVSSTGGSTGEPTPFIRDAEMLRAVAAARSYAHLQMGWRPGMATVCLWGSERDIGRHRSARARFASSLRNFHLIDGYEMSSETVVRLREAIDSHPEVAIYGFTSMLEYAAREILRTNGWKARGRVKVAWNGGETLHSQQSDLFLQAFGVPILNLYGGRELGAMAYQRRIGTPLHVLRPFLMLEILDGQGQPVRPGETGRLVWTSTICKGTPFLRYDIGDIGRAVPDGVDGVGARELASVEGRQAGILTFPNGTKLQSLFWNHLFKDYPEIIQFQVAFVDGKRLELRLRGTGLDEEREGGLIQLLRSKVGECAVSIKWVERIPLTQQGKLLQVVRE